MRDIASGPHVTGEFICAGTQHLLQDEASFEVRPARALPRHRGHDAGTLAEGPENGPAELNAWRPGGDHDIVRACRGALAFPRPAHGRRSRKPTALSAGSPPCVRARSPTREKAQP